MKTVYQTEDGKFYTSFNAACFHEALMKTGIYLDSYKVRDLVEALDKEYILTAKTQDPSKKEGEQEND